MQRTKVSFLSNIFNEKEWTFQQLHAYHLGLTPARNRAVRNANPLPTELSRLHLQYVFKILLLVLTQKLGTQNQHHTEKRRQIFTCSYGSVFRNGYDRVPTIQLRYNYDSREANSDIRRLRTVTKRKVETKSNLHRNKEISDPYLFVYRKHDRTNWKIYTAKFAVEETMKALRWSRGTALLFL